MSIRRDMGQYMTPESVARLMCAQIRWPISEWQVLDPACGDGNLLLVAVQIMKAEGLRDIQTRVVGLDIDPGMVSSARRRISQLIGCAESDVKVFCGDFLSIPKDGLFQTFPAEVFDFNIILSNPPYGRLREYHFFDLARKLAPLGSELVFLMPLAFLDRASGITSIPLPGKPLGVTTGHTIIHYISGETFLLRKVNGSQSNGRAFKVLHGVKLYELGAGNPVQTEEIMAAKPYSSESFHEGWLPCLRTGDVRPFSAALGRLWVNYGLHLAHPKDIERFSGPRILIRRMPMWPDRLLGAAYIEDLALSAGDVLIIRHERNDGDLLKGLCVYLNSPEAAEAILEQRPSVRYRESYPKIAAKDLNKLIDSCAPSDDGLRMLTASNITHEVRRVLDTARLNVNG
jgi:SAM-dependent methyltransferase